MTYCTLVEFTPPHTPLEAELCDIFSDILGVKLGTTHNFFESGGTSMTAISCLLLIKQKCHVSISVSEFYVNPSVVQLAALVQNYTIRYASLCPPSLSRPCIEYFKFIVCIDFFCSTVERYIIKLHTPLRALWGPGFFPALFLFHGAIRSSSPFSYLHECLPKDFPFTVYALTDPDGIFSVSNDALPGNILSLLSSEPLD
jgi:hypothetical protein